jgi:MFS family permease
MGIVADVVPEGQRARWVGVVMGSYAAGFFFGPMLGGFLYDNWGYAMPFLASAVMGALGLVVAFIMVPETRTVAVRKRELLRGRRQADHTPGQVESLWASLPRPLYVLGTLLWVDFMIIFAFAFVDPQMIFFLYDELGWTTLQFGVVIAVYGLVAVLGQGFLGRLSDRVGRKPVIIAGTLLNASFYAGLVLLTLVESGSFVPMLLASIVAGLGEALVMPALSAAYMDITAEQHRSRVMGIKESAASLGGVLGPLLVVGASAAISSRGIFVIALVLTLATALVAALGLHTPQKALPAADDATQQYTVRRALVAQATLHGIVTSARQARIRQSNI